MRRAAVAVPGSDVAYSERNDLATAAAIGLLFTPALSARQAQSPAATIRRSWAWIAVAVVWSGLSMWILGPGVAVAIHR